MEDKKLYELLEKEFRAPFEGWDFSYLRGRMTESEVPWNYRRIVCDNISKTQEMLDMGTGGGEFLGSLPELPPHVYATEGYEPNVAVAKHNLEPKGVTVKFIDDDARLPFEDSFFDIVTNRHESFSIDEIKRILKYGGLFITQQVGGLNNADLFSALTCKASALTCKASALTCKSAESKNDFQYFHWNLTKNIEDFREKGMTIIEYDEFIGKTRFEDIGAIAYYIKCIMQWSIPDFSVEKYFPRLKIIAEQIEKKGYIDFLNHKFYFTVKK